jgi:hypothetical protein
VNNQPRLSALPLPPSHTHNRSSSFQYLPQIIFCPQPTSQHTTYIFVAPHLKTSHPNKRQHAFPVGPQSRQGLAPGYHRERRLEEHQLARHSRKDASKSLHLHTRSLPVHPSLLQRIVSHAHSHQLTPHPRTRIPPRHPPAWG